jgi:hypothetical protein
MITGADLENREGVLRAPRAGQEFVTPGWLAHVWGVHPQTVYRDIRKGALAATRLPGGQYRVALDVARRYGKPVE